MSEKPVQQSAPRALALDALRGLAILGMCLSGRVPFGDLALPAWMYHAQEPPAALGKAHGLPGYTWVDLVFPLFLFSMGVAFPFAMSSRLRRGFSHGRILLGVAGRTVLLGFFALYFQHVNPWALSVEETVGHAKEALGFVPFFASNKFMLAFLGFLLLFPVYTRLPKSWPQWAHWSTRAIGAVLVAAFLWFLRYPEGGGFSLGRSNIILVVLTNMVLFGSVIWLFTRGSIAARLACLAIGVYGHWANYYDAPFEGVLSWTPLPWIYQVAYLKYLLIVIPGTIIGDQLYAWMKAPKDEKSPAWDGWHLGAISFAAAAVVIGVHIGLHARVVFVTAAGTVGVLLAMKGLFSSPAVASERLLRSFYLWGSLWLIVGLLLEPAEGGIAKSPSTWTYYFTSLGLSIFCLIAFLVWIDLFHRERWFGLLILPGQNPMLAYLGINNLMEPIFQLKPLAMVGQKLYVTPWLAGLWGFIKTVGLAILTSVFTKLRIYWRT